jgi:hypothetical protein
MTSSTAQTETIHKVVTASTLGFGVAGLLAPNLLAGAYGVSDPAPEYTYVARLWGSSLLVLGTLSLKSEPGEARRSLLTAAVAQNVADALAALTASGMPARTRLMAAATSAGFAAANLAVLGGERRGNAAP